MLGQPIETDSESGAQVYLLGADDRPADNNYCEQPYNDPAGRWVAIRYFPAGGRPGGLSAVDMEDGSRRDILAGNPGFPAFHAWGECLYYKETVENRLMLRRYRYDTFENEDVAALPLEMGSFSYGTVSPDHRYYAVSVSEKKGVPAKLHLLDLQTRQWRLLLDKPGYHTKHEQFSMDGRNRVLIQLNHQPDKKKVLLGELTVDGEERLFPADRPHTPRPTGHEAWIGASDRIFFSTYTFDRQYDTNIWIAKAGDNHAARVCAGKNRFRHVSVSRCGLYWISDTYEEGIPIYAGRFGSGTCRRIVFSRTVGDGNQWSHPHPYLTADNQWLIFNSTRGGHAQVYGAKLASGWLEKI